LRSTTIRMVLSFIVPIRGVNKVPAPGCPAARHTTFRSHAQPHQLTGSGDGASA
jgi:hypothetical protein